MCTKWILEKSEIKNFKKGKKAKIWKKIGKKHKFEKDKKDENCGSEEESYPCDK